MANSELLLDINNNLNPTQIIWENANYFGYKAFVAFLERRADGAINNEDWNIMNSTDPNLKVQKNYDLVHS